MSKLMLIDTFTRERERLRSIARRFLHSDSDAEDTLQDAFLKLWQRVDSIDDAHYSAALAVTTVKNLSIDRRRKRHIATTEINEEITVEDTTGDSSHEELINDIETIIEQQLTATQRRIIHLRDYEGKDYDDIARETGLQPTAVRMQLSRARQRIREIYNERRQ